MSEANRAFEEAVAQHRKQTNLPTTTNDEQAIYVNGVKTDNPQDFTNHSEIKREAAKKHDELYPKKTAVHLTDEEIRLLINALSIAEYSHTDLIKNCGHLMPSDSKIWHRDRASEYGKLSQYLQK